MFNEYKQIYKECADLAPGWSKLSLTELCDKYIEYKDINKWLADSYFSALVYKAWDRMEMLYHTTRFCFLNCYNIVIDSLLKIIESHIWTNKDSKLYNDPDAARIALNVVIKTKKMQAYDFEKSSIRKANIEACSLDELIEEADDTINDGSVVTAMETVEEYDYNRIVKDFFSKKNYFAAILIDLLMQGYGFENKPTSKYATGYNKRELKSAMLHLDDCYCRYFASRYNVDYIEVKDCLKYIFNCTSNRIDRNILFTLRMLREKYFKGMEDCLYEA